MADTQYAWSPIQAGDKSAKFGDQVTAEKLGISKEDFEALVDSKAVRPVKPPQLPEGYQGSVIDFYREKAKEAALEAGMDIDQASLEAFHAVGEVG